nr:hypothetical protein BaRGS_023495 [Batillaria attramentaria]
MCKLYFFVNYMAYTASILLLVVIALERYIAITHPLRSRRFLTASRLVVAQVVVWVVAAVYNIPILIVFDLTESGGDGFCFYMHDIINMKTYYTAHFVLWYMLPLIIIVVMYGHISCTLWASSITAAANTTHRHGNGSVNTTITTAIDAAPHRHGGNSMRGCLTQAGRTCVTYCEGVNENGFGSVVTVGVGGGGGGGGGGRNGNGNGNHGDGRREEGGRGMCGSKPSLLNKYGDEDDVRAGGGGGGGKQGGGVCWSNTDKGCRFCCSQTRDVNGHMEMKPVTACNGCFNCNRNCLANNSPSYGQRTGSPKFRQQQPNARGVRRCRTSDDYEMSDIGSSDDYDSYRSRLVDGNAVGGLAGGGDIYRGGNGGGGGGNAGGGHRRLRCHYRVSSQRGLKSRRRVIRLLIAVVTTFAVCVLPYHVRNLLHYWQIQTPSGGVLDILSPVASVMMYLNSGLNPFIYWMFSDHFRRSLKESLCFWKRSRHYPSSGIALHMPRHR